MSNVFADFPKLTASIDALNKVESNTTEPTIQRINSVVDELKAVGENHDSCFSDINSQQLVSSVEKTSSGIIDLIGNIDSSISFTSAYSAGLIDEDSPFLKDVPTDKVKANLTTGREWDLSKYDGKLADRVSKQQLEQGYDYEYYNRLLSNAQATTDSQSQRAAINATFLATVFPHMDYFWGGGHYYDVEGVDPEWGVPTVVQSPGDDTTGTEQPRALDCSGFVDWAIYNSGFDKNKINHNCSSEDYYQYGETYPITSNEVFENAKPGDIAHMSYYKGEADQHVGVVVAKNDNELVIAHSCGSSGMTLTSIDMKTGKIVDDSGSSEKVGEEYFTDIIIMNYDS